MAQPLKTSEDFNFKMRRSFSWDRAFFTNDGFLDADELSSMIQGDGNDVKQQLEPIEGIEKLEAKLFEEMEASTKKSTQTAKTQASKVRLCSSTPIKTQPTRSSPLSGGSPGKNNVKSSTTMARSSSTRSITSKPKANSPLKTPPGSISTKNKAAPVNAHLGFSNLSPRARPASPNSPGSSGSSSSTTFALNQRSSRGRSRSAPRRSSRDHEQKPSKPSNINLKIKPPPNTSHPSSPLGLSSSSSTTSLTSSSRPSQSSSSSHKVTQRSKSTGRATSVNQRSLHRDSPMKARSQTPDRNRKQQAVLYPRTSSVSGLFEDGKSYKSCLLIGLPENDATRHTKTPNSGKERKLQGTKRSSSPRPCRVQSRGVKNLVLVSPEVLDIKGKINALKMEISMQKKEKGKETKMVPTRICKSESSPNICKISSHQMNNQARRI